MRPAHSHSFDSQLQLFELEAAPGPVPRSRRRRRRPTTRILLTVLALGLASAGVLAGSFAAWTAQSANPSNTISSGTLTMTNSKNATSIFTATNVKPGDTGSSTVVITNSGNIPMSVRLTQDSLTGSTLESSLGLKIHDVTRNRCYWPVDQAGACPVAYGAWNASATLAAKAIPATDGSAQWPAGQAHTFTVSWELAATSPNGDQGKTGSFRLVWDGTQ